MCGHFREQIGFCDLFGSPFTARLLDRMLGDLEAGGPVAALLDDWPRDPRADAVALRLCGALHAAVLSQRDDALARQYPGQRADWDMDAVWPLARDLLVREREWVAEFIASPPQTNDVRRSIVLLLGFLRFAKRYPRPFDVLELGASAGLNLSWDRFGYRTSSWSWGDSSRGDPSRVDPSRVDPSCVDPIGLCIDTDWRGPIPPIDAHPVVRARAACDQAPLDLGDPEQRTRLRAYIWADQRARLARFDAAADLALRHGVKVDRADAAEWVQRRLSARAPGVGLVVYHSVFLQYPRRSTRESIRAAIESAGAAATEEAPLAWLRLEPEAILGGPAGSPRLLLDLVTWPGGERQILAATDGHASSVEAF